MNVMRGCQGVSTLSHCTVVSDTKKIFWKLAPTKKDLSDRQTYSPVP